MPGEAPSFVERLRNRHVFRVAAMYAVTAWVLLQIGDVTFAPLGLPGWSQTALIVVLGLGFPIAIVLAWVYDVTPDGIVKTDEGGTPATLTRWRRIDAVIIAMLVVALAMALFWQHDVRAPRVANASIAVLPFVAMSDDASMRHLGEGLAEEITNQLAGRPGLVVASRTSAFRSHEGQDVTAIAQALGVAYVLEGSVRPTGDLIRLTVQLVRAHDGFHTWSETYDLPAQSSAAQQDETVRTVGLMVDAQLDLESELQTARQETANDEAYARYVEANRLRMQLRAGGTTQPMVARQILDGVDKVIALDPDFASAHGLRANVYINLPPVRGETAAREARRSVDRALALKPDDPRFNNMLALIQMRFELDLGAAQRTLDRLREIDPDHRFLNESFASLAMHRGRTQEAIRHMQQQIARSPYNAGNHYTYGNLLHLQGDLTAAEREFDTAIRLAPRGFIALGASRGRIEVALDRGDHNQAAVEFERLWVEYRHVFPEYFGYTLARLGREADARALIADMTGDGNEDPALVFAAYYGLKDYDHALTWLRRAIDDRNGPLLRRIRLPNAFPGLQDQPGFVDVLTYLDSLQRSP